MRVRRPSLNSAYIQTIGIAKKSRSAGIKIAICFADEPNLVLDRKTAV